MNSPSRGERAGHRGIYETKVDEPTKRNFVSSTLPHVYFMLNFRNLPRILDFNRHRSAFTVLCVLITCGIMGRYSRSEWSWRIFHKSNGWSVGSAYWYTNILYSNSRSGEMQLSGRLDLLCATLQLWPNMGGNSTQIHRLSDTFHRLSSSFGHGGSLGSVYIYSDLCIHPQEGHGKHYLRTHFQGLHCWFLFL